jgi:hypothetical protein
MTVSSTAGGGGNTGARLGFATGAGAEDDSWTEALIGSEAALVPFFAAASAAFAGARLAGSWAGIGGKIGAFFTGFGVASSAGRVAVSCTG